MNPRIMKEARLLFGPWCLMVAGALLPLFSAAIRHFHELASLFCGFALFGGVPFLIALSFGGEFQQRTISLLLGQPVGRMQIWKEKQLALVLALLAAIPFFWIGWDNRSDLNANSLGVVAMWLLATVCSTTYWTLLTRSTLGGLVLGQAAQFLLGAVMVNLGLRIFGEEPSDKALVVAKVLGAFIGTGYSALMLWLGWRKLASFEVTGGTAGEDLLMVGPRVTPRVLGELLRCRPTGATLNFIRKEFRLLRPLGLIAVLFLACWVCIVVTFRFTPQTKEWKEWAQVVPLVVICIYVALSIMLAGCLTLGEERNSGTHAWNLTLPMSARRQWFIKLVMALGTGVFCAMLVPFLAVSLGQMLLGSPFGADFKWGIDWDVVPTLQAVFASFPAFWCACAVKGTVRAALWTLPVLAALCFVGAGGFWLAQQSGSLAEPLVTSIVSRFQLNPASLVQSVVNHYDKILALWLIFPVLLVAIVQSCWLYRMQPGDKILPVIRHLVPLAIMAFLCCWSFGAFFNSVERAENSVLVQETRAAIEKLHMDAARFSSGRSVTLTVDELAKVSHLSAATRRWLRDTSITMASGTHSGGAQPRTMQLKGKDIWTSATIHFPDGSNYDLRFRWGDLGTSPIFHPVTE